MALIGENLGDPDQVNGAVFQSRRGKDRVSIWIRNAEFPEDVRNLGQKYQDVIGRGYLMKFQKHFLAQTG